MRFKKVGITKARIKGLTKDNIHWLSGRDFYTTDISFFEKPRNFKDISNIYCGKSFDNALKFHDKTIKQFDSLGIHETDEVVVLFDRTTLHVLAVGKAFSNLWIDMYDDFKVKSFGEFNIIINDLTVY